MIYLIGGSPRSGKTVLGHQVSASLRCGWISTDLLYEILRAKNVEGIKTEWDASPEAIIEAAEWFFPSLERFVWRASSTTESYVIEGVDFLPNHIVQLADKYSIRSVFLGCSKMTLERFDKFPGHSFGYAALPKEMRQQVANDVPKWSKFIQQEAKRFNLPYVDMSDDFPARLSEAEKLLTALDGKTAVSAKTCMVNSM